MSVCVFEYIYMSECQSVCMHVWMYVCMYVCVLSAASLRFSQAEDLIIRACLGPPAFVRISIPTN